MNQIDNLPPRCKARNLTPFDPADCQAPECSCCEQHEMAMQYEDWVNKRNWWKSRGPDAFRPVWHAIINAGHKPVEAAAMLDRIGHAMADEYGGSF